MTVVALLHPGKMGSRIGGELVGRDHEVRWLSAGRSAATRERARTEGLIEATDLATLVAGASVVLSVCPPQGALDVAGLVATSGFSGIYVEANPVSGDTLAALAAAVGANGAALVDGGIVGPPPRSGHRTHLYLAGPPDAVSRVADLFAGSGVTARTVGEKIGAASAAKQAYALFNKGRVVLAGAAADLADAYGVLDVLAGESDRRGNELLAELAEVRSGLDEVGWRWGPEFAEIGAALGAAGLDDALARSLETVLRDRGFGTADGRG